MQPFILLTPKEFTAIRIAETALIGRLRVQWRIALVILAFAAFAAPLAAQGNGKSAYENMDSGKLANRLSGMGMTELLDELAKEVRGTGTGGVKDYLWIATSKIALAGRTGDVAVRSRLLDEAIVALRKVVEMTKQATTDEELVKHYEYRLQLAETMGLMYIEPYLRKLLYLQGGQEDRDLIVKKTGEATKILADMDVRATEKLQDWRGDLEKLVTVVPLMEDLQKQLRYRLGWIRCYRAMAMPIDAEHRNRRASLLRDGIGGLGEFASGDNESGVKYAALRGCGIMAREWARSEGQLSERDRLHAQAAEYLNEVISAGVKETGSGVRMLTLFEIARNLIEWGKFPEAKSAVDNFERESRKLLGKNAQLQADVKTAMLLNYLYENWASSIRGKDPEKAAEYDLLAQKVLLDFVDKHTDPGIRAAFFSIIASKYRGREDYDKLNALILLAVAISEASQESPEALEKSRILVAKVLERKTKLAQMLRPTALWQMGLVLNRQGDARGAGKNFLAVARDHAGHVSAAQASIFSVKLYYAFIDRLRSDRKPIPAEVRNEYIEALKTLVENPEWGKKPESLGWNFDLGQACAEKARFAESNDEILKWMDEAIRAYNRVPSNLPTYMYSRFQALNTRVDRVLDEKLREKVVKIDPPRKLTRDLLGYARDAKAQAEKMTGKTDRNELMAWGARSAFNAAVVYYEVMDQKRIALDTLSRLPGEWPSTPVLGEVTDYRIRKMIENRQTQDAIKEIREFGKRHPGQAEDLIRLVVSQIRDRIENLRGDEDKKSELATYQETFLSFAKTLFDSANQPKPLPLSQRYALTQMYADALLEAGQAAQLRGKQKEADNLYKKCLELFKECRAYDDKRRGEEAVKLDKRFAADLSAIRSAVKNEAVIRKLAAQHLDVLKTEFGVNIERSSKAGAVIKALRYLDGKGPDGKPLSKEQRERRLAIVVKKLTESIADLRQGAKAGIPVDLPNVLGMARAYSHLRNLEEARRLYKDMMAGIDPVAFPDFYWRIQVEYCDFLLNGYSKNPEVMSTLALRIRQLRADYPSLGGLKYRARFNAIQARAEKLAG